MPPSPQRTPSRKQSLVDTNPFIMCASVLEEVNNQPETANEAIEKLLEYFNSYSSHESLMDMAKENGKQLYAHMSTEQKLEKINFMVSKLRNLWFSFGS